MRKNLIFGIISAVFYILYFFILDFTLGNLLPISPITNVLIVFILVVINIPLSVFSAEKVITMIKAN